MFKDNTFAPNYFIKDIDLSYYNINKIYNICMAKVPGHCRKTICILVYVSLV
jgi:hypothetical protein